MIKKLFATCTWIVAVFFLLLPLAALAESSISLINSSSHQLQDNLIWHKVEAPIKDFSYPVLLSSFNESPYIASSLIGRRGGYMLKLAVHNKVAENHWNLIFNANFIDKGIAYWKPENGLPVRLKEFSQLADNELPTLLHYQSISLPIDEYEIGELLIYVQAQHFAYPLSLEFVNQADFIKKQFAINTVSIMAITVMLTLALISFILYIRTRYLVTLACAGYIGLHGIGWAAASGLLVDAFDSFGLNTAYGGIYIFPFAIASASQFTRLLFNCDKAHFKITWCLNTLTFISFTLGLIIPWLHFHQAFAISHGIAILWIPITVFIGFYMLKKDDFRAKYYLFGNVVYTASLGFYMLTHFKIYSGDIYPELVVVSALSVDCICILLSMTEWLKSKQIEYNQSYSRSRIDPLTQVGNRYALNERLAQIENGMTITFIDLDGMKKVNDELGHEQGDLLLKEVAVLMHEKIAEFGEVFRTGGDEFIWVFDKYKKEEVAECPRNIQRLISEIEVELHAKAWKAVGISFGIANNTEAPTVSACLTLADQRMYENKRGKNITR